MPHSIRVAKLDRDFTVDFDNLPENAQSFLIEYGIRQKLNDAISGLDMNKPNAEADGVEKINAVIAALVAGEIRLMGGREGDPVKAEAKRLATVAVNAAIKAAGKVQKQYKDQLPALVEKYLAKHPEVMDTARENVAARGKAASATLDELLA